MPPVSDRLFIRLGQFFEGAAEGRYAVNALTSTLILTIVIVAVVHFWRA